MTRPAPIAAAVLLGFALGFAVARATAPTAPAAAAIAPLAARPIAAASQVPEKPESTGEMRLSGPQMPEKPAIDVAPASPEAPRPNVRVSVRVPPALASELIFVHVDGNRSEWSHGQDVLALAPGKHDLQAYLDDYNRYSDSREVHVPADGSLVDVALAFAVGPALLLKVELPEGETIFDALVEGYVSPVIPTMPIASALRQGTAVSFSERWMALLELRPGSYWVGVRRRGEEPLVTATVTIGSEPTLHAPRLPPIDREAFLVVTVSGPTGEPLEASVDLTGGVNGVRRGKGVHWFPRPTAPAELVVAAEGTGTQRFDVPPGARELAVRLTPGVFVDVTLEGYTGTSAEGATQIYLSGRGGGVSTNVAPTMRLGPVAPGPAVIHMSIAVRTHHEPSEMLQVPVHVGEAGATVTVRLPTLHEVTLQAPGAGTITMQPMVGPRSELEAGETGEDGLVHLARVPAGRYLVRFEAAGKASFFTLRIPGPAITRLEERTAFALLHDGKGDKMILHDRDVVVAVNGRPIDDEDFPAFVREKPGEVLRYSIRRGAEALDIEATWYEMWQRTGNFRPVPLPE